MTHTLQPIVIVPAQPAIEKSILDQILELPVESIVVTSGVLSSVLHRTGPSGWLVTRAPDTWGGSQGYLHRPEVEEWVAGHEGCGDIFTVVRTGREF